MTLWLLRSVVALTSLIHNKVRKHEKSRIKVGRKKKCDEIKKEITFDKGERLNSHSFLSITFTVSVSSTFLQTQLWGSYFHFSWRGGLMFMFYKWALCYAFIWQRTFRSEYVWTSLQSRFSTKLQFNIRPLDFSHKI